MLQHRHRLAARGHKEVRRERDEFLGVSAQKIAITCAPKALVELNVVPFGPAQLLQRLPQTRITGSNVRIGFGDARNHTNAPHPLTLLRPRRERPRRRAAEQSDELAASHSITSSARASSDGGTSRPRAFAVLRLITSSYLVGACTGRSAGFSPLRMRST